MKTTDGEPLDDSRWDTDEISRHAGDGHGGWVVLDARAYQALLDRLDRAEAVAGIHRGLVSMRRGEGVPAKEALDELGKRLRLRA